MPRGGSENPEGGKRSSKQTLNMEVRSELLQKDQDVGSSQLVSKQAVDKAEQRPSVGLMEPPRLLKEWETANSGVP